MVVMAGILTCDRVTDLQHMCRKSHHLSEFCHKVRYLDEAMGGHNIPAAAAAPAVDGYYQQQTGAAPEPLMSRKYFISTGIYGQGYITSIW